MRYIRNILAGIGFLFVIASLIYAIQIQGDAPSTASDAVAGQGDKNVADTYQITAIAIPEDLNFAGRF